MNVMQTTLHFGCLLWRMTDVSGVKVGGKSILVKFDLNFVVQHWHFCCCCCFCCCFCYFSPSSSPFFLYIQIFPIWCFGFNKNNSQLSCKSLCLEAKLFNKCIKFRQWVMMMKWCLMSSDVSWHIRDKHGSI